MSDLGHLLSPLRVGPLELANRVVSTSHQTTLVHDHLPMDELVAYHAARARGGAALIMMEATAVHPSGLLTGHTLAGYHDAIRGGYERIAAAVQPHGTKLMVQLFHGGREQIASPPKAPAVAPSAVPSTRFKSEPRALTVRELAELIDGYAAAARMAREGGLDGIEISMAHGYLVAQFLGSENRREDGYNGDLTARLRFAREVIAAVRGEAGPGMAVGIRLAADELGPGLLGVEDCAEVARELSCGGAVDFVSLALGHSSTYAASTYIAPPSPAPLDMIAAPGARVRAAVAPVPVLATTRVHDLDHAERMVAGGQADLVGMTRAMIADPELVAKARAGRAADVIECIGCNQACIGHYHAGVPIGCVVNPRTGRELTAPPAGASGAAPQRVLVVGAGPAGASAALESAAAGHAVTLADRAPEIGGQLRLAGGAPAHRETWERYRRSTRRRLEAAGVELRLGREVGPDELDGWDRVVLATGARPYEPSAAFPGAVVVQAWAAIADPAAVAGPVLVIDWGGDWAGLDAAELLAAAGLEVTLASAATVPGETLHQYQRNLYLARLDEAGVRILHHHELAADERGDALLRHAFSLRTIPLPDAATIVLAQGRVPADELWSVLEDRPGAVRAGDVLGPRTAEEAVLEGAQAVWA
jgi:2,4-dienoyl-CoA reductase-like NADH-dependent reductase (Old Yellow Enzyme family)